MRINYVAAADWEEGFSAVRIGAIGETVTVVVNTVAAFPSAFFRAHLYRIQIIKGWLDKQGNTHEKVYDVAWSGERNPSPDGRLPPIGNSVDVESATLQRKEQLTKVLSR